MESSQPSEAAGSAVPAMPSDRLDAVAAALGWTAAAVGGLVLVGWVADVPLLRSLFPGQVEAKPNAAACFVLTGVGLALQAGPAGAVRRGVAAVCALAVLLLSLLTLGEYATGGDWGIDQLLFVEPAGGVETVVPGRMTLPASVSFALLGVAVLALGFVRGRRAALPLGLAAAVVSALAFLGYLFDFPRLASFGPFTPLPALTGINLLVLATGIMLAAHSARLEQARRSGLVIGFGAALALLLALGVAVVRNTQRLVENNRLVTHTHEVLNTLAAAFVAMQNLEAGSRGYLLTGNPAFLEPARDAPDTAARRLEELRRLVADSPVQASRRDVLEGLVAEKVRLTSRQIELHRGGAGGEAQHLVAAGEGRRIMDAIRATVSAMSAEEYRLLQERQRRAEASTDRTLLALGTGLAASLGLLVAVFVLLRREVVARTRLAGALRRSEQSLAVTLHSIGDGVLATDTAGRITLMNPVAERLTGWPLAEARGRLVAEVFRIVHEETRAPVPIPVESVLATGKVQDLANHTALVARDGTERAIADSAAPIRDSADRIVGVVLVFRDVTEARRAHAQLDRFFELSLDFLCIAGADGCFKRASPAVTDILGWTVEEFLAKPYLEQVHPDDRAATVREVERQIQRGERVVHFENRYRHRDGTWRTLAWHSAPYGDLMYATARDVTEARRAEEEIRSLNARLQEHAVQLEAANAELRQGRAELQSLFESLPGLYLVLSLDYRIVAVSDAYLKATMTERASILNRGLFEVFPDNPDDPKADGARNLRASLDRVAARREPDTMAIQKYDVRRPDGVFEERYWSPINSPLLGAEGQLRYIIHRVEDVTEFVRQNAPAGGGELQARLERMEADIFQSSRKMQAAKRQLEIANQELESFSYSVSHDLRAPLRHVQGYVQMLARELQGGLSEKGRRYLDTIAEASREMGMLIDDLLSFSRMGRAEMRETEVDTAALVAEVRASLEPETAGRDVRWTIAPLPPVRGDAAMLRLVFTNLMGNAVKYTRRRPTAQIEVGCDGAEDGGVRFFVRDNGAGFDMKYADKLFGVFQRLHRADEFEGTGIGLATVRRIVGRHGGRTWAESRVDGGATFFFTLPPAAAPAAPATS